MNAPDDKRCAELADNYEFLAKTYRGDEADESVRCADIAAALRAVVAMRALRPTWVEAIQDDVVYYDDITAILGATETQR